MCSSLTLILLLFNVFCGNCKCSYNNVFMKCAVGIIQIVIKYSWNLQLEFTVVYIDDKGTHGICTFFLVVLTYFCRMHHSYSYFCTVFLEFAAGRIVPYLWNLTVGHIVTYSAVFQLLKKKIQITQIQQFHWPITFFFCTPAPKPIQLFRILYSIRIFSAIRIALYSYIIR